VDVDSRLTELIALSLLAALGCGVTLAVDRDILAAIFAAWSAAGILAAVAQSGFWLQLRSIDNGP
jgi:hypothetical protein